MKFLYDISIFLYKFGINIASLFNTKAKLFVQGRKNLLENIALHLKGSSSIIWLHCSSVGEFEQARPVIEWIKANRPQYKILLTFFSPSGYELRKNYDLVDWVFYMPIDTPRNAKNFIDLVVPQMAIFVKYEFWYNHLNELRKRNIDTYIISSIFRPKQIFFKWYGGFFRSILKCFTILFVQDSTSTNLLQSIGLTNNVIECGDTRFDRVHKIVSNSKEIPIVEEFAKGNFVIVGGSTWGPDEEIIASNIKNFSKVKLILVPHEISKERLHSIDETFASYKILRYSQLALRKNDASVKKDLESANVLVIDTIGLLSSIYKYGHCAYIGGGFGVGIHNILEAATYGIPVIFGPNYHKFKEAIDLLNIHGAYSIKCSSEFYEVFKDLVSDKNILLLKGDICRKYVESHLGATSIITSKIFN